MFHQTSEEDHPSVAQDQCNLPDIITIATLRRPKAILTMALLDIKDLEMNTKLVSLRKTQRKASRLKIDCTAFQGQEQECARRLLATRRAKTLTKRQLIGAQDFGIKYLMSSIRHLSSLTDLNLSFVSHSKTTNKSIIMLFKTLKQLSYLSNLSVNLAGCYRVADGGIESVNYSFKHLSCLSSLYLDLTNCILLTDKRVQALSLAISGIKTLLSLHLNFTGNFQIADNSLKSLSLMFRCLDSLQSLSLNFCDCKAISDWDIKDLFSRTAASYLNIFPQPKFLTQSQGIW